MSNLAHLSLTEAAETIRKGEASATELLDACLAQLDAANEAINAVIWIDRDGAHASAKAADQARRGGTPPGPLHGIPLAHKDMFYQAGRPCTCGSEIRRHFVAETTATVITRLAAAGAVNFAGLNMAEFAQNPTGHNAHYGDCRNPWNLPYITGGSSSGSGAAVAARATYGALGSDTGGSVRLPASACGVSGIKPTQTRVSRAGVMPLSFSHDNVGPLARTARDLARILGVIAGHDPRDPTSATVAVADYEAALDGDLRGTTIGLPDNDLVSGADDAVRAAIEETVSVFEARGAQIERLTLPLLDAIAAYGGIVSRVEGATIHAQWLREHPGDYATHLSARMYPGLAIPAAYYVEALSRRGPILKAFADTVFRKVDALITPTIRTVLPTREATDIDHGPPGTEHRFLAVSDNTRPFNYLGLPAATIPCGFDPNGLPIGLQIAGRPFAEARVLKLADAYQRETDFHRRLPPLLGTSGAVAT